MKEKFNDIYELYSKSIFRLAYSYVFNKCDAEDIVQKSFYKLYGNKKILSLQDDEIKRWLFKVTSNEAKDLLKSSWHKKCCSLESQVIEKGEEDNKNDILELLKEIPTDYRIPLYLYYYEGYKIKEIATIIKKSEATVKMRLARGKEILKSELEDDEYGKSRK